MIGAVCDESLERMGVHKLPRTIATLAKREATLHTLVKLIASESRLLKASDRVRDARIQVLRARIGEMPSVIRTPEQDRRVAELEVRIGALRATSPKELLDEFQAH